MKKLFSVLLNTIPRPILIKLSLPLHFIFDIIMRGNNFQDPINKKYYRSFLPYGYENQRKNALSPGTLSLERHRFLWLYLKTTNFFKVKSKVLHMAPEQCFIKRFKTNKNIEYITADLLSPIADVKADITKLPFNDNEFDWVICNHVLEHIENDAKAMSELYRVMKYNGRGIFQIPLDYKRDSTYENWNITTEKERKIHFGQYDHVRVYGLDYFSKLEKIGFKVEKIEVSKMYSVTEIEKYGLDSSEILPLCIKSIN